MFGKPSKAPDANSSRPDVRADRMKSFSVLGRSSLMHRNGATLDTFRDHGE